MKTPSIEELFEPLVGLPCWNVRKGYASFLTFEFGEPRLDIIEPMDSSSSSPHVRKALARRTVSVLGQWHLWIYCCAWQFLVEDFEIATWESEDEKITEACSTLDGQILEQVMPGAKSGETIFRFDLGGQLNIEPSDEELNELWLLFCPDSNVYTYRSDGASSFGPGDSAAKDEVWTKNG